MAVIPEYRGNTNNPGGLRAPRQSLSTPAEAFGKPKLLEQAAQTADALTKAMIQHQAKLKEEKNAAWVSESMAALANGFTGYAYGKDGNPGALGAQGKEALGLTGKASSAVQAMINDLISDDADPDAVRAFKERATLWKSSAIESFARHEAGETRAYNIQASADNASAQMNALGARWKELSPEATKKLFDEQVKPELEKFSALSGKPVEGVITENRSKFLLGIINQNLAAGQSDRAESLYKSFEKDLEVNDRVGVMDNIWRKQAENKAESLSDSYASRLRGGESSDALFKEIEKIGNDDVRNLTRRMFKNHVAQFKAEQRDYIAQATADGVDTLDSLAGDLIAQQRYYNSLPSKTQSERTVKERVKIRLNGLKRNQGIAPGTDPEAYAQVLEEINLGKINDPKQIEYFAPLISKQNRETLKKGLSGLQKVSNQTLKESYARARGIDGGSQAKFKDTDKADFGKFMMFAEASAKASNKGTDPAYLQALADRWVLSGESKTGGLTAGYGKDETFGQAWRNDRINKWLPDMPEKTMVDKINTLFKKRPDVKRAYVKQYGDGDLAVRGYYRDLMEGNE